MSCNTMRDLEYEREEEEERDRRRKRATENELTRLKAKADREKKRREKAEATIREQANKLQWILKESFRHPGEFNLYKPGTSDHMKVTVFEDGVVRVDTPGVISPQNHPSADAFMGNLKDILKGKWVTVKKYLTNAAISGHSHTHTHGHTHTH